MNRFVLLSLRKLMSRGLASPGQVRRLAELEHEVHEDVQRKIALRTLLAEFDAVGRSR
jgi:hypothetical protein